MPHKQMEKKNKNQCGGGQTLDQVAREAVVSPSLEMLKAQLDTVLGNLL